MELVGTAAVACLLVTDSARGAKTHKYINRTGRPRSLIHGSLHPCGYFKTPTVRADGDRHQSSSAVSQVQSSRHEHSQCERLPLFVTPASAQTKRATSPSRAPGGIAPTAVVTTIASARRLRGKCWH
ncbi:hypothetical protein EV426DRAFT_595868 [Tirmania nivea]|nr:hypothetical protein EV426DRAFT_595868 [Tirmania nivea]